MEDKNESIPEDRNESIPEDRNESIPEDELAGTQLEALRKELQLTRESAEGSMSKLKYLMADFENYRRQMERQVASKIESGKAELLLKLLNIRDDFQRAIETARQKESDKVVIEGLEGILKNVDSVLSSEDARPIEAVGASFDPNIHDAIAFSDKDIPENTVTGELRRGYTLNGKVLRPSMVEISRKIVKNNDTANTE